MAEKTSTSSSPLDTCRHTLQVSMFIAIIVAVLFSEVTQATHEEKKMVGQRREKRNTGRGQGGNDHLTDILRQYEQDQVDPDLIQYTPSTPRPGDVNCFVEVPVTRRVGGRCVPLGTQTMGCQAGIYLAFSSECMSQSPSSNQGRSRWRNFFRRRGGQSRRPRNTQ